jgi:hypothetical protein
MPAGVLTVFGHWSIREMAALATFSMSPVTAKGVVDVSWTPNVEIADQSSKASPALASFGRQLHMVHLGNSSNNIWHSWFDGSRWTRNVQIPDQSSKASPALASFGGRLHMVHLGNSSNNIWHSWFDGSRWSANFAAPNQLSKAAPALAAFGSRLHMVHLGNSSNNIWHSTSDGILSTVRIGLKTLVAPTSFSISSALTSMRSLYEPLGFDVQVVDQETLDLPALEILDAGECVLGETTEEQRTLFANRDDLRANDIAIYFVRSTVPAYNGCAAHPAGIPACVVVAGATQWTMAHEVGHVLGLRHVGDSDNLMFRGGTGSITNLPPDIDLGQAVDMGKSQFSAE